MKPEEEITEATTRGIEFHNICPACGAENTLWPFFFGKRRTYKCEKCGYLGRGVSKAKYLETVREERPQ